MYIRFSTALICFVFVGLFNAFAVDDTSLPQLTDNQTTIEPDVIDVDGPLFNFPISRAIGIDIPTMLTPRTPKPSVYDLAPRENSL